MILWILGWDNQKEEEEHNWVGNWEGTKIVLLQFNNNIIFVCIDSGF